MKKVKIHRELTLQQAWDAVAGSHAYHAVRHDAILLLLTKSGGAVLDVGCGHGFLVKTLCERGYAAVGTDVSAANIATARETTRLGREVFVHGDACSLGFSDATFDVVIATDVLEHIEDQKRFIGELRRVCKRDGEILLTFPSYLFVLLRKVKLFAPHQPIDKPPSPRLFLELCSSVGLEVSAFATTGNAWRIVAEHLRKKVGVWVRWVLSCLRVDPPARLSNVSRRGAAKQLPVGNDIVRVRKYSKLWHILCGNVAFRLTRRT